MSHSRFVNVYGPEMGTALHALDSFSNGRAFNKSPYAQEPAQQAAHSLSDRFFSLAQRCKNEPSSAAQIWNDFNPLAAYRAAGALGTVCTIAFSPVWLSMAAVGAVCDAGTRAFGHAATGVQKLLRNQSPHAPN